MGFGRGTEIFDTVASKILDDEGKIEKVVILEDVLEALYEALRDCDWDNYDESDFYGTKIYDDIRKRQGDWNED